ncbi:MAG TPA: molybdopterin-dependent oxidoreductase [Bacilli bacterium]
MMEIAIYDGNGQAVYLTVEEMVAQAPLLLPLDQRVPGIEGKAFDLKQWYFAWRAGRDELSPLPTYMLVEAVDQFQARIPWGQLDQAVLLYSQNGLPLEKGFPIRLYVPDGSSNCLNVKSIVRFDFIRNDEQGVEAEFGFKNRISTDELKKR